MRIRLRPYHPTYVIGAVGRGKPAEGYTSKGMNSVVEKVKSDPEIEIELVQEYDDICAQCTRREEDEKGSVWGKKHSCPSSRDQEIVDAVNAANRRVLDTLGLDFGSVIKLKDLAPLLRERIPVLEDKMIGGPALQKDYEKGFDVLAEMWK